MTVRFVRSNVAGGLIVGCLSNQTSRPACFVTAVDPMTKPKLYPTSQCQKNEPRLIPYRSNFLHHHDDMAPAQDRGLMFYPTLIQKIENHPNRHALQQDLRQNQSFNPFSPESKKLLMKLETLNCVNCSRRNPKRSAKYVYHTGTLELSIARAGTSCVKAEKKIRNSSSTRWIFFQFQTT